MKLLIVNNVSSGYNDGSIYDFARIVARDGDEVCMRTTDGTTDVSELLNDAEQFDAAIVAGGDGTIASAAYALANTNVPLLPFPAGTANLLANNLNLPFEPTALAKIVRDGRTLDFDLGEVEAGDKKFGFSIMAGAGYDAKIMLDAKPNKKILGPIAYFQAAVSNPTPQVSAITMTIDGEEHKSEGLGVLLVNFSKIQFDITVTHENHPRDGMFDIVVLKAENAFGLIPAIVAGLRDRDGAYPDRGDSLEIFRGNEVSVVCDPPMEIQFDGELPEVTTPFTARVLSGATRFLMSENGLKEFESCINGD